MTFSVLHPDEVEAFPMTGRPAVKIQISETMTDTAMNIILSVEQAQALVASLTAALESPLLDFAHTNPWAGEDA